MIMMMSMETDDVLREAGDLLYSLMHPPSLVFIYRQRYGPNSLQATARAPCSIPTNNNNVHHTQK
jgi:hypothetical protein